MGRSRGRGGGGASDASETLKILSEDIVNFKNYVRVFLEVMFI